MSPSPKSDLATRRRAALQRARLYLCIDARSAQGDLAEFVDAAYTGGVDIIQLRDKSLEARAEIEALEVLREAARRHGKLFAANDRADVAALVGADVFHVGQRDLTTAQARRILGDDVIIGRSNNSLEQFSSSYADPGLDYAVIGPVWPTPTKPGRPAVGLDTVRSVAQHVGTGAKPWFAIGGVDATNLAQVKSVGAERIVVVRAIADAPDPAAAARLLRAQLPQW
ncbi:thiamine phosphate synthase [Corynebacterium heidelbergense]|uniref:Thiamine-phosphate synthase n=1 Tax=Corynebacterium heidelbergense TaxID=2055947 RepID=A0A364V6U9_9CORY|nr:thiamine phosphate synthase [Corynebacterium heidelbergense]RAV32334.1 thiamine phosphate synthase [Corynebacterium heidelbergense]